MNYIIRLKLEELYSVCKHYGIGTKSIEKIIHINDIEDNLKPFRGYYIVLTEEASVFLKLAGKIEPWHATTKMISTLPLCVEEVKCDLKLLYWAK